MQPRQCQLVVSMVCLVLVQCKEKSGRFLSFNSLDEDLTVDLEFSIPFLKIPVKKAMDAAFGNGLESGIDGFPSVNVNAAGLVLGGVVAFGSAFLLPLLIKGHGFEDHRFSRILDSTEFGTDFILDFANQMSLDTRMLQGCALRVACWNARQSSETENEELLRGIISNRILSTIINSTAVETAMSSGRQGSDCSKFGPCPLRESQLPGLLRSFSIIKNKIRRK